MHGVRGGDSGEGRGLMARRVVTRVLVFLLLGAIVNVAVAWGCALICHYHSFSFRDPRTSEIRWIRNLGEQPRDEAVIATGVGITSIGLGLDDPQYFQQIRALIGQNYHVNFVSPTAVVLESGFPFR